MLFFLTENPEVAETVGKEVKWFGKGEGFLYALIGFLIVLAVLFVLMGFIYLLSFVAHKINGDDKKAAPAAPAAEPELAPGSSGSVKLYNVDDRTAAMVMAIVADEMQTPLNELRFLSIKEVSEEDE